VESLPARARASPNGWQGVLKGDTAAIILDGIKIVQKSKQRSIENKTEQQNKYWNSINVTNFHLFYKNNAFRMTLLLLCNYVYPVVLLGHHVKQQKWPLLTAKHFQTQLTKKCSKFKSVQFWRHLK
jgi:hypothetical protein